MQNKFGFTLIELLAVAIILGILTAIAVPQYTKAIQRSEASHALINLKAVYDSAKRYYSMTGVPPTSFKNLDTKLLLNTNSDGTVREPTDLWYGTSGNFQFTFAGKTKVNIEAHRVTAKSDGSPERLYTLTAFHDPGSTAFADNYHCKYEKKKYRFVCQSLCGPNPIIADSVCKIK